MNKVMDMATERDMTAVRISKQLLDSASIAYYQKHGSLPEKQQLVAEALRIFAESELAVAGDHRKAK